MDAARFKELQDDEQREDSPEGAIRTFIRSELVDVHTSMPGIVKSFDASKQTAVVQPAIRRLFVGKGFINLPQCLDVPVLFPRAGNFVITFPVAAGDECLLTFGERAIDFWWDRGGTQEPTEPRMHDLSDAFAHLGCSSRGRVPSSISGDALELRTLDGSTLVRIEGGAVIVGQTLGAEFTIKGETYRRAEDAFFLAVYKNLVAALGANGLPSTSLDLAKQAFDQAAATGAFLAQKAKVG